MARNNVHDNFHDGESVIHPTMAFVRRLAAIAVLVCIEVSKSQSPVPSLIPKSIPGGAVLLHRVGEPASQSSDNGGGSDGELDVARGMWLDIVDRFSGAVISSIPWPTTRTARAGVQHWRCVQSLRSSSLVQMSTDSRSIVASCADATPLVDRIPSKGDGSEPPVQWVLSRMTSDGAIDTRTLQVARNSSRCAGAWPSAAAASTGEYFVVSTVSLPLARDPTACPLMVVPWGNQGGGEWVPNSQLFNVTAMHIIFQNLLLFDARPEPAGWGFAELGHAAQAEPPIGAPLTRRFVSAGDIAPGTFPQRPLAYLPDSIEIAPNADSSYRANDGKMGWAVDTRPGISNASLFVYELKPNVSCCDWSQTREYAAPDGRPIVSIVGVPTISTTGGDTSGAVTVSNARMYVVTALAANSTLAGGPSAGSTLFEFDLPAGSWRQLASLPCCGAIWRSVMYPPGGSAGMSSVAFVASPTAQPLGGVSDTPAPTRSATATATRSKRPSPVSNSSASPAAFGAGAGAITSPGAASLSTAAIAGIAVGAAVLLAAVCCCAVVACRYRRFRSRTRRRSAERARLRNDRDGSALQAASGSAGGHTGKSGMPPLSAADEATDDAEPLPAVDAAAAVQLSSIVATAPESAQRAAAALAGAVAASLQQEPAAAALASNSRRGSATASGVAATRSSVTQAVASFADALQRAIARLQREHDENEELVAVSVLDGDAGSPETIGRSVSSTAGDAAALSRPGSALRQAASTSSSSAGAVQRTASPGRRMRAQTSAAGPSSPAGSARTLLPEALVAVRCMQQDMEPAVLGRIASVALRTAQSVLLREGALFSDGAAPGVADRHNGRGSASGKGGLGHRGSVLSVHELMNDDDIDAWLAAEAAAGGGADAEEGGFDGGWETAATAASLHSGVASGSSMRTATPTSSSSQSASLIQRIAVGMSSASRTASKSAGSSAAAGASASRTDSTSQRQLLQSLALVAPEPVIRNAVAAALAAALEAAAGRPLSDAGDTSTDNGSAGSSHGPVARRHRGRHGGDAGSASSRSRDGGSSSASSGDDEAAGSRARNPLAASAQRSGGRGADESPRPRASAARAQLTAHSIAADPGLAQRLTRVVLLAALQASRQTVAVLQEAHQRQLQATANLRMRVQPAASAASQSLSYYYSPTDAGGRGTQMAARPSLSAVLEKHTRRRKQGARGAGGADDSLDEMDSEAELEQRLQSGSGLSGFLAFAAWQSQLAVGQLCPSCCRAASKRRRAALAPGAKAAGSGTAIAKGDGGGFFVANAILAGRSANAASKASPHSSRQSAADGQQASGAGAGVRAAPLAAKATSLDPRRSFAASAVMPAPGHADADPGAAAADQAHRGAKAAAAMPSRLRIIRPSSDMGTGMPRLSGAFDAPAHLPGSRSSLAGAQAVGGENVHRRGSTAPQRRVSGAAAAASRPSSSGVVGASFAEHSAAAGVPAVASASTGAGSAPERRRLQRAGSIGTVTASSRNVLRASLTRMGSAAVLTAGAAAAAAAAGAGGTAAGTNPSAGGQPQQQGMPSPVRRSLPGSPTTSRRL